MKLIVLKNNVPISEVLVETPDTSEQYEFFVGRADDCHVLIDDPLISRHHLVIKNQGPNWFCEKLTTLGVVMVNGDISPKSALHQGSEIKCGVYSILVSQLNTSGLVTQVTPLASAFTQPAPAEDLEPLMPTEKVFEDLASVQEDEPLANDVLSLDDDLGQDLGPEDTPPEEALSEEIPHDTYLGEDGLNSDLNQDLNPDNTESDNNQSNGEFGNSETENLPTDYNGEATVSASDFDDEDNKTRFDNFFVNYQLVLFGEHAPYDRYSITLDEVFIGRDEEKCQIILNDPEVSSVHAVLRKTKIDVIVEDLNSSNGTILNGERINRAHLSPGDEFVIGGTSFTLEVVSDLLDAEKDRLMPVEAGQMIEKEEIEEEEVDLENGEDINFDANAHGSEEV